MSIHAPEYVEDIAPYQAGKPISELAREYGLQDEPDRQAGVERESARHARRRRARRWLAAVDDLGRYPDSNGFELKARDRAPLRRCRQTGSRSATVRTTSSNWRRTRCVQPGQSVVYAQYSFAVYALATQEIGARAIVVPARDLRPRPRRDASPRSPPIRGWCSSPIRTTRPVPSLPARGDRALPRATCRADVVVVLDEAYNEYLRPELRFDSARWLQRSSEPDHFAHLLEGLRTGRAARGVRAGAGRTDRPAEPGPPAVQRQLAGAGGRGGGAVRRAAFLQRSYELNRDGLELLQSAFASDGSRVRAVATATSCWCGSATRPRSTSGCCAPASSCVRWRATACPSGCASRSACRTRTRPSSRALSARARSLTGAPGAPCIRARGSRCRADRRLLAAALRARGIGRRRWSAIRPATTRGARASSAWSTPRATARRGGRGRGSRRARGADHRVAGAVSRRSREAARRDAWSPTAQHQAQRDRSGARHPRRRLPALRAGAPDRRIRATRSARRPCRTCSTAGAGCCVPLDVTPQEHCERGARLLEPRSAQRRDARPAASTTGSSPRSRTGRTRSPSRCAAPSPRGDLAERALRFAGAGLRDTTRIGASSPTMWADILLDNREAVPGVGGAISRQQRRHHRRARGGRSRDAGGRSFRAASRWRNRLG